MDLQKEIDKLKVKSGYSGKSQQWQFGFDLACRELAKAQAVPDGFVLNKPAKVGSGTFGIGVKWSIVIGAAQRQFEYTQNDVGEKANIQNLKGILFDVPEGFVLVPREPTQELLNKMQDFFVGAFENGLTGGQSIHCAYIAMIEAQEQAND